MVDALSGNAAGDGKQANTTFDCSAARIYALQKRLLSSVEAFARTLRVHARSVERQDAKGLEAPR